MSISRQLTGLIPIPVIGRRAGISLLADTLIMLLPVQLPRAFHSLCLISGLFRLIGAFMRSASGQSRKSNGCCQYTCPASHLHTSFLYCNFIVFSIEFTGLILSGDQIKYV
ncbi:hypothetical protein AWM70_11405 [Paenibacillus yonginensis]|uniref:Uncharacterized protein n=1 Tax=Paenibacillus yonginensis TaxID=1462996 RepID=A0A1B1N140_9BACL|nr:hypothetical protein AWM70_11405 [Paenibacillus yonginensis]